MTFQALLVSKDDEAEAVLTPVLSGFGLEIQSCGYPEALCRINEQKFDALIVDYDDPHSAAVVLRNADQTGTSAVTIALLGDRSKVRNVFGAGANFVLYKPLSEQQAEATMRAATALLKRERRRGYRIPVQIPVQIQVDDSPEMEAILLDLSEDGMEVLSAQPLYPSAAIGASFQLPDDQAKIDLRGEVAWANPNGQSGVRFLNLPENLRGTLRAWVITHSRELPPAEPEPLSECKLTDLSLGGCYVETGSPFPERSGVILRLRAGDMEVQAEGLVRVMHPAFGMGIEFASHTAEQRERVEKFIDFLSGRPGTHPELLVNPGTVNGAQNYDSPALSASAASADPLLDLLRNHETLTQEEFLHELRKQRSSEEVPSP
jgi:CheY-like chemotaxis protein